VNNCGFSKSSSFSNFVVVLAVSFGVPVTHASEAYEANVFAEVQYCSACSILNLLLIF
jgi:hypothetical protein